MFSLYASSSLMFFKMYFLLVPVSILKYICIIFKNIFPIYTFYSLSSKHVFFLKASSLSQSHPHWNLQSQFGGRKDKYSSKRKICIFVKKIPHFRIWREWNFEWFIDNRGTLIFYLYFSWNPSLKSHLKKRSTKIWSESVHLTHQSPNELAKL